jgi:signal peptidase I
MSANARRFFGCFLPLTLAVFGCGALLMLGYAGQIFVQVERVSDAAMTPILDPGWDVIVDNTAHWTTEPERSTIVTIERPDRRVFRRVVGLPGETIEIRNNQVYVNGAPCDPSVTREDGTCNPGAAGQATPDLAPITLGPYEYFVMSENWDVPDSRAWGPIARDDIFGIPSFRRTDDGGFAPIIRPTDRPALATRTPRPPDPD